MFEDSKKAKSLLRMWAMVAAVIMFLITPVATRIFSPEVMGVVRTIALFIILFNNLSALSLPLFITYAKTKEEVVLNTAVSLAVPMVILLLSVLSFTFLLLLGLDDALTRHTSTFILIMILHLLISPMSVSLRYWSVRNRKFGWVGAISLFAGPLRVVFSVALVMFASLPSSVFTMVEGNLLGVLLGLIAFTFIIPSSEGKAILSTPVLKIWETFKVLFKDAKWMALANSLTIVEGLLMVGLPAIFYSSYSGEIAVLFGFYTLILTVIVVPGIEIVIQDLIQAERSLHAKVIRSAALSYSVMALVISLIAGTVLSSYPTLILGPQWGNITVVAMPVAVIISFMVFNKLGNQYPVKVGKPKLPFIMTSMRLAAISVPYLLFSDIVSILWAIAIGHFIAFVVSLYLLVK